MAMSHKVAAAGGMTIFDETLSLVCTMYRDARNAWQSIMQSMRWIGGPPSASTTPAVYARMFVW